MLKKTGVVLMMCLTFVSTAYAKPHHGGPTPRPVPVAPAPHHHHGTKVGALLASGLVGGVIGALAASRSSTTYVTTTPVVTVQQTPYRCVEIRSRCTGQVISRQCQDYLPCTGYGCSQYYDVLYVD